MTPKNELTGEQSAVAGGYSGSYGYDKAGNPTTYTGVTLTFDAEDHPVSFGTALTAGYTGNGLRAWKQSAGGKTYFLYDGASPVCVQATSSSLIPFLLASDKPSLSEAKAGNLSMIDLLLIWY